MSTTDVEFSPESFISHGSQLQQIADAFEEQTNSFLSDVSDASVLGEGDKIGKVANKIYRAAHIVGSVAAVALSIGMSSYADDLNIAGETYRLTEENNAALGTSSISEMEGL